MQEINKINYKDFSYLEKTLIENKMDSDRVSFLEIKNLLKTPKIFTPDEFAKEIIYVICVSGFKQATGKKIWQKIVEYLENNENIDENKLLKIFNNKAKIKAIIKNWNEKESIQKQYYHLKTDEERVNFLGKLNYIGAITRGHLARNLGVNIVKYDIWIQKLGVAIGGNSALEEKIDNGNLHQDVKYVCDNMFDDIARETGEKEGYIDVVLWKSCSVGLLKIVGNKVFMKNDN